MRYFFLLRHFLFRVDNNETIYMKPRKVTVAYSKCSNKVTIPYSVRNEPLSALIKQQDPAMKH